MDMANARAHQRRSARIAANIAKLPELSSVSGSGASPSLTLVLLRSTERTPPNIRPLALAARTSAPAAFAGHHQAASAPLGFRKRLTGRHA